nr:replication protein A 70 kDa DNA-binding subunit C-like [Lolium perenne]
MEVDLTHGAVAAMSRMVQGLRPVLQLEEAPRTTWIVGGHTELYGLVLSDGVHSQKGLLATSLNGLVKAGLLRGGSVVRVLDYICNNSVENPRVIAVIQLEILQTECTLIGSPTFFDANASQPKLRSYSDSLGIHRHCMISRAEQGVTNIACYPDQSLFDSSNAARVEIMQRSYGLVPTPNTIDAKMQQLSLKSYQSQVPSTVGGFDSPGNTYGQPVQSLCEQAPPMYLNRYPVVNSEAHLIPISALTPYQGRWTIKARVTGKTEPGYLGKAKIFSFDLLDANGGQIRAIGLNSAIDLFYDKIVPGNVYLISGGLVKPVPKMLSPLNSDYQIILVPTTSIEIYSGDDSGIPGQKHNFRQISEIANMEKDAMVDLLGVVTSVSPSVTIVQNALKTHKRTIQLKDMSGRAMAITLWGNSCSAEGQQLELQLKSGLNPILSLKSGIVVSGFSGKSVGTTSSSQLKINPDLPETEKLRQWYATQSKNNVCRTITQIKEENFGMLGQPGLITVVASISYVHTDAFCYPACTLMFNGKQCNKKVTANGDGWWCKRCLRSSETCDYRYLLMCQIQDHSGSSYATAFHEAAEEMIGHTAQELYMIQNNEQDAAKVEEILRGILWRKYLFKLRVKEGARHGVKLGIVKAEKFDPSDMSRHVLGEIDNLFKGNSTSASGTQGMVTPSVGRTNLQAGMTAQTSNNASGSTAIGGASSMIQ